MRLIARGILWCALLGSLTACLSSEPRSKKAPDESTIVLPAGTRHPVLGLAFDISYDPATDGIIPGYRIFTVGITNDALGVLQLNPLVDKWFLVDRNGTKRAANFNLRRDDPDVWTALPDRLKQLIEYPLLVNIGETRAIDLLFSDKYNLADFKEIIFESRGLGKTIRIYARESTQ